MLATVEMMGGGNGVRATVEMMGKKTLQLTLKIHMRKVFLPTYFLFFSSILARTLSGKPKRLIKPAESFWS